MRLRICIDALRHLDRRVPQQVLFDLRRDARLLQPRRVGVAQDMRRHFDAAGAGDAAEGISIHAPREGCDSISWLIDRAAPQHTGRTLDLL